MADGVTLAVISRIAQQDSNDEWACWSFSTTDVVASRDPSSTTDQLVKECFLPRHSMIPLQSLR